MANYDEKTKDELVEEAKSRELSGYSTLNKADLVALLEEDDAKGESSDEESAEEADDSSESPLGADSEASDEENPEVVENLSEEGQEALEEMGDEQAAEADLALDASGPLHLQKPSERLMGGAVSEEHAQEQEELVGDVDEDYVGDFSEAGEPLGQDARKGSGPNGEVLQEDVIDFPPPQAELEQQLADEHGSQAAIGQSTDYVKSRAADEVFPDEGPTIAQGRLYEQRAQVYTDGLSGQADHNLALSYRVHDVRGGMFHVAPDERTPQDEEREALEQERKDAAGQE